MCITGLRVTITKMSHRIFAQLFCAEKGQKKQKVITILSVRDELGLKPFTPGNKSEWSKKLFTSKKHWSYH